MVSLTGKTSVARVLGEGIVIVVSVLVALSADAWWDSRHDATRRDDYVRALVRDFDQMSQRMDQSLGVSGTAVESGSALLRYLDGPTSANLPDSAVKLLRPLFWYEAFSPSIGGYEALVASGDLELLNAPELMQVLADFFGSFQDLRVSEEALRVAQHDLIMSEEFSTLVGAHRIHGNLGLPTFGPPPVARWATSDFLLSRITALVLYQSDVLDDYRFLRSRIDQIQERLTPLQRAAS